MFSTLWLELPWLLSGDNTEAGVVTNQMSQRGYKIRESERRKAELLWEYGTCSRLSGGGALVTHGSFRRGLLIKRHRCSSALSRTAAGYNTKQRDFPNCLHTCRAVEVCQLATRCLLTMYERKQLKEGGGWNQRRGLKFRRACSPQRSFVIRKNSVNDHESMKQTFMKSLWAIITRHLPQLWMATRHINTRTIGSVRRSVR